MRSRAILTALLIGVAACHPQKGGGSGSSDPRVITREEIEDSRGATAYDVVQRLRARYLVSRGPNSVNLDPQATAFVFLNEQPYGPLGALRNISANDLESIRFYTGPEAVQKFGAQYGGGVIQLVSRVE